MPRVPPLLAPVVEQPGRTRAETFIFLWCTCLSFSLYACTIIMPFLCDYVFSCYHPFRPLSNDHDISLVFLAIPNVPAGRGYTARWVIIS